MKDLTDLFLCVHRTKTSLLQLQLSPLLWRGTVAAACQTFSVACSKTLLLNTGLISSTSTVKYAPVNKRLRRLQSSSGLNVSAQATDNLTSVFEFHPLGQKTEDEPAAKKAKLTKKPETKLPRQELHSSRSGDVSPAGQPQVSTAYQHSAPQSYQANLEPAVPDSQPQLHQEELNMMQTSAPTPVIPAVSSVTITRRDPRMARHSSGVIVTYTAPEKPINSSIEPLPAPVSAPAEVPPKAPLPMPPAPPPSVAASKPSKTRCSITPQCYELAHPGIWVY